MYFIRNICVDAYLLKMSDKVYDAQMKDIDNKTYDPFTRWETLRKISYPEMVLKFWRPFGSFLPDGFPEEKESHGDKENS